MGLFGGLVNTWKNGYQFGDITKSLLYDLNPIAWAGDALIKNIQGDKDFDMFENNPNWTPSAEDPIDQGIVNTWNKMTGNAHLTPEAQHAEEREDTINQRTATDMMLAGLSKFGMSGSSAGASSHANGLTMLDMIGKAQQIQAQAQSLKEMKYNLGVSKRLGIRTGDKNSLGQLTSIAKALFGLDLSDIPEEGIIPYFVNILKGAGATGNGATVGAAADAAGAAASTGARATWLSDPYVFEPMKLDTDLKIRKKNVKSVDVAGESNDSSKKALDIVGVNTDTSSVTPESNPSSYGVFSNDFKKDARSFVQTMVKDKMVSTDNLDLLANQLSKRYNLSVEVVRKYLTDLVRELR